MAAILTAASMAKYIGKTGTIYIAGAPDGLSIRLRCVDVRQRWDRVDLQMEVPVGYGIGKRWYAKDSVIFHHTDE